MKFTISVSDKKWVEKNFFLFIKYCGFPENEGQQFLFNKDFFPKTHDNKGVSVDSLIKDFTQLFNLRDVLIQYEILDDLRDSYSMPLEIYGKVIETELIKKEDGEYFIQISRTLCNRTNRLLFCLTNEFCKIKLHENNISTEHRKDEELYLFLAAIYFGFGLILTQRRYEIGKNKDGYWESTWRFVSNMPDDLIIYAFALYLRIFPLSTKNWINELPREIKKPLDQAEKIINESCSIELDRNELLAAHLSCKAYFYQKDNNYTSAYKCYDTVLELSNKPVTLALAHNSIGYAKLKQGSIDESIIHFKKAIQYNPDSGFANDNLGYSLILSGNPDLGFEFLMKAIATGNNDKGYSLRNQALYYHKKNELQKSKELFDSAFQNVSIPIDFIEYHYADLLFDMGETEKGFSFLEVAANKGELIAIDKLRKYNKNRQ